MGPMRVAAMLGRTDRSGEATVNSRSLHFSSVTQCWDVVLVHIIDQLYCDRQLVGYFHWYSRTCWTPVIMSKPGDRSSVAQTYKIVVVGGGGVGKSAITIQFIQVHVQLEAFQHIFQLGYMDSQSTGGQLCTLWLTFHFFDRTLHTFFPHTHIQH